MMQRFLALAPLALLASCQAGAPALAEVEVGPIPENDGRGVSTYVDPETGCEYLVLYDKALTPRLSPGGLPYCGGLR
jgi:hypothetical protein